MAAILDETGTAILDETGTAILDEAAPSGGTTTTAAPSPVPRLIAVMAT